MKIKMHNRYQFGPFLLNARERQLMREGEAVHLQPKSFDVLLYLLEHAGSLVGKQEVMDAVWKQAIVTENSLTTCIRQIRIALGDDAESPRYIETIPASGYRFITEVTSPDATTDQAPLVARRSGLAAWIVLMAVLALVFYTYLARNKSLESAQTPSGRVDQTQSDAIFEQRGNSIAVLPFVNMSEDPENAYFTDGLSEEITNLLGRIPDLRVIGRTSSFAYRDKTEDLRVIGRRLGVQTLLEGSVRKSGDRIRITTQLIDASNGSHIWSERYDRTMTDVFEIQDEVAVAIINALQLHVSAAPTRGRPTENAEAYALFLRAKLMLGIHDGIGAEPLLLQATVLDPGFAEAHELQAFSYWSRGGSDIPTGYAMELSRDAAAAALAIDPDLEFARAMYILPNGGGSPRIEALNALQRAWRDNPFNWAALRMLVYELHMAGYRREANRYAQEWVSREPVTPMAQYTLGETLFAMGRVEEAQAPLMFAFDLDEGFALWYVPAMNQVLGKDDLAISQLESLLAMQGINDRTWVRDLLEGGRDPQNGQAYLDRRTGEVLASLPDEHYTFWRSMLEWQYLQLGYLDRYYDFILAYEPNRQRISDADVWFYGGMVLGQRDFVTHPRFLDVAAMLGITEIWDVRGPPDFCSKTDGHWTCE